MEKYLNKIAKLTVAVIVVISAFFSYLIYTNIELDYDFENFFPEDDKETAYYKEFREQFGTDNDFVLVAVSDNQSVFSRDFLRKVSILTDTLSSLPYITEVVSPTNIRFAILGSDKSLHEYNILDWDKPEYYATDSANIFRDVRLVNTHFSADGKSVALLVKTKEYLSKDGCDSVTRMLEGIRGLNQFEQMHIAGRSVGQSYYVDLMQRDFVFFFGTSAILLVIFLWIAFRSIWGLWVPMTIVLLSTLWTVGVLVLAGQKVNLMLTMLPTIMFVVGISDVIHIISRYLEELRSGENKTRALIHTMKDVGVATFLTSFTTAIGFFTLITVSVGPIRDFGLYTGIGVFLAYVLAFTLLPAVLILHKTPPLARVKNENTLWHKLLRFLFVKVVKFPKIVMVFSILLMLLFAIPMMKVQVNNYLLEDLSESNVLKRDFLFFEEHYAGVRPFEAGIEAYGEYSLLDSAVLKELEKVEQYLVTNYGVGYIISPVMLFKSANMALHGGEQQYWKLPIGRDYVKIRKRIEREFSKDTSGLLKSLMTPDFKKARLQGKIGDFGSVYFKNANMKLVEFLKDSIPENMIAFHVTGTAHLVDKNNSYLAVNMITGLLIAFTIISLLAAIFFKSLVMIFIALLPNVLPLVLIAGIMGLMGQDLKVTTSIIFTIAFGIAVDDTIHLLSKFKLELNKGRSVMYALKRSYLSTGRALILTTLILCSGFLTLMFSEFTGTFVIGLLISITLFIALITDLTLLPALLILFYRRKKKT